MLWYKTSFGNFQWWFGLINNHRSWTLVFNPLHAKLLKGLRGCVKTILRRYKSVEWTLTRHFLFALGPLAALQTPSRPCCCCIDHHFTSWCFSSSWALLLYREGSYIVYTLVGCLYKPLLFDSDQVSDSPAFFLHPHEWLSLQCDMDGSTNWLCDS